MVTQKQAVQLWEDHVGDSGHAPTDEELHAFALAVEEKARKPFVKLQKKWKRKAKEHQAYADNNYPGVYSDLQEALANGYKHFSKLLKNRLDARN